MTSRDFCYWLQGYFELRSNEERAALSRVQVEIIQRHLAMVFKHEIDPSLGSPEHQAELQRLHDGNAALDELLEKVRDIPDRVSALENRPVPHGRDTLITC